MLVKLTPVMACDGVTLISVTLSRSETVAVTAIDDNPHFNILRQIWPLVDYLIFVSYKIS